MTRSPKLWINAILAGMAVTVGLWFLLGDLSLAATVLLVVLATVGLAWASSTVAHIWAWATLVLGLESFAWPIQMLVALRSLGPEPPLEDMQRIFTAVLFGLFAGIFWLTFAYGIFRWNARKTAPATSATISNGQRQRAKGKKRK